MKIVMKKCGKIQEKCGIWANLTQANLNCWAWFLLQPTENNERKKKEKRPKLIDPIPSQACKAHDS